MAAKQTTTDLKQAWPKSRSWLLDIEKVTKDIERDEYNILAAEEPTAVHLLDRPKEVLYAESALRRLDGMTVAQMEQDLLQFEAHIQSLPDLDVGEVEAEIAEMEDELSALVGAGTWSTDTCALVHRRIMQYRPRLQRMRRLVLAYHHAFMAAKPYFWSVAQAPYIGEKDTVIRAYAWNAMKPFQFSFERVDFAKDLIQGMLEMLHSMGEAAVRDLKEREYALGINGRIVNIGNAVMMDRMSEAD